MSEDAFHTWQAIFSLLLKSLVSRVRFFFGFFENQEGFIVWLCGIFEQFVNRCDWLKATPSIAYVESWRVRLFGLSGFSSLT